MKKKQKIQQLVLENKMNDGRIAAVRDLIFGEDIKKYNAEFLDISQKIATLKTQTEENILNSVTKLENKLIDLESSITHKIDSLSDSIDKKIANDNKEKETRVKIGKALEKIASIDKVLTVNLGTGNGYSVLDMIKAFEKVSGKKVAYKIVNRRPGDIAKCFADPSYAKEALDWEAKKDIEQMCEDSWRWQSNNPDGF